MLSVLRILGPSDELIEVVTALDLVSPDAAAERRPRGDGYGLRICDSPDWTRHLSAIEALLGRNRRVCALAKEKNADLVIDVAVEPEDMDGRLWRTIELPIPIMDALVSCDIEFAVSIYAGEPNARSSHR